MNGTIASCPWFGGQAGGAAKAYAALSLLPLLASH